MLNSRQYESVHPPKPGEVTWTPDAPSVEVQNLFEQYADALGPSGEEPFWGAPWWCRCVCREPSAFAEVAFSDNEGDADTVYLFLYSLGSPIPRNLCPVAKATD